MVVRRESVHLSLEDQGFVTGIARDAAAVALLKKEINDLNGTSAKVPASLGGTERGVDRVGKSARSAGPEIDKLSGRLTLLRDVGVTIGPALLPIGAAVVPLLAGLTVGLGATVGAAGTATLAFSGLGDALKALNDYELDKTPENLAEVNRQLKLIGPAGSEFVQFLDSLEPGLRRMQMLAREGLLPGVEKGIKNLVDLLPDAKILVSDFATTLGRIAEDAGADLAGDDWRGFIEYLKTDAAPTFDALARSLGNFAQGFANIIVGLAPATRDFSGGLLELSQRFAAWSSDLDNSDGFRGFAAYVQESGPQVMELLAATAQAIGGIAQAAAPLGSAVLPVLTELARILGAIANSPFGSTFYTAVAGLIAYNRVAAVATRLTATMNANLERTGFATKGLSTGAKLTGLIAALYAVNQLAQQINKGLNETDLSRNLEAYANGMNVDDFDKIGARLKTVSSSFDKTLESGDELASLFGVLGDTNLDTAQKDIESIDQALATMVESGNADQAAAAFERFIKAAESKGVDGDEARRQFDAYNTALGNVAASTDDTTSATQSAIGPTREYADAIQAEAQSNRDAVQAMRDHRDAILANFDAETQYRQALKDAKAQADKNEAGIRGNSDAALENRNKLSALAAAWNNQSAAVRNNNGRFKEARKAFIETAQAMGVGEVAAKRLANQVLQIPKSRVIKVETETSAAESAIARIKAMLNDIPRTLRTDYYVNQVNSISRPKAPQPGAADGTTVPKTGLAYADRHLYLLADGEEVISNRYGQADRHRAALKAINGNRLADGGTAGRQKPLFSGEGPQFYARAYRHNKPFALDGPSHWDWPYQTDLRTARNAEAFANWVRENNVPFQVNRRIVDYDMRGFWMKTKGRGWHHGSHFPDTFKTPYDTTFSHESKYATADNPFFWHGDRLIDERNGRVIFASGGATVPKTGGTYVDRHPYMLADGEEVISNRFGQADKHRDLLKAINAGRLADGGTTGSWPTSGPTSWPSEVGHWSHEVVSGLKGLKAALKESETALDKQRAKVDAVRDKMSDLSGAVSSGLKSDLLGAPANTWAAGAGGIGSILSTLDADTAVAKEFTRHVRSLKGKGLDGAAMAELLSTHSIEEARLFDSLPPNVLKQYERKYEQRAVAAAQAGNASGSAAFGGALATQQKALQDQVKETRGLRHDVKHLEAELKKEHKQDRDHHTKTAKMPAAQARRRAKT